MYLHRATSRALVAAQIVLLHVLSQIPTACADVSVNVELADQLPPLAHVKQPYDWQFLADTFKSSEGGELSYTIKGLPDWASFDGKERRITGDPRKSGRGDETHDVEVTAKDGSDEASSSFQLTTIAAPAPSLNVSLRDQLPEAASMGFGNMLPNKVLHMPLGWSFSVGFDGGTFVLPEDDRVYYSTYLEGAKPLPDWLVFNEEEMTYSGIAPTDAGPNGTMFNIVLIASNRRNTGGPTSSFQMFLGDGIITLNNSVAALPSANVTEGDTLQYHISPDLFLLDGFAKHRDPLTVDLGEDAPSWVSFDANSYNLTGKAPFEASNKDIQNSTIPLHVSYPNARNTTMNVTLHVYPSPFTLIDLPNVTVQAGKDFNISLESYLRDDNTPLTVSFGPLMQRRSIRWTNTSPKHRVLRRSMPSWVHYNSTTHSLVGKAPSGPQHLSVDLTAPNPNPQAPTPGLTRSFELIVKNSTTTNTTQNAASSGGLSGGEKGAIAGSILGAALLALLATLFFCCIKRRRSAHQMESMPDMENQDSGAPITSDASSMPLEDPPLGTSHAYGKGSAGIAGVGAVAADSASNAPKHSAKRGPSPTASGTGSAAAADVDQPYKDKVAPDQNGVTQTLPVDEPEWRRDDDQVVLTPFLSQSTWQSPVWTQMATATREKATAERPGASSPLATMSATSPSSDNAHFTMAQEHIDESPDTESVAHAPKRSSRRIMAMITAPSSSTTHDTAGATQAESAAKDQQVHKKPSTKRRSVRSVPPVTVTEAEPEERITELPGKVENAPATSPAASAATAADRPSSGTPSSPQPASFLVGFVERTRVSYPRPTANEAKPAQVDVLDSEAAENDANREPAYGLPASISKISKASWEDNLWYEPSPTQNGLSATDPPLSGDVSKAQQRMPTDRPSFLSAFAFARKPGPRPVSREPESPTKASLNDSLWLEKERPLPSSSGRPNMPSIIPKANAEALGTSVWGTKGISSMDSPPQLDPISTSSGASPLVPGIGDPPTLSTKVEPGLLSPMTEFVAPPTQPMDVKRTSKVASYTPKLESMPALQKNGSIHVESRNYGDMFEDADEPMVDPFAGETYPYGTVLYQQQHADAITDKRGDDDVETLEAFRSTEGGLATMHFTEERGTQAQGSATGLPRSGTMASIQMAETRSVTFSAAKPPRLQLASCHPGQAISLPLTTSDTSLPRHLMQATDRASAAVQYVPQLYAPSRPDLHQKWPGWLHWLSWDPEHHELTGLVPPDFAELHRLPLQLPIHILLDSSEQDKKAVSQETPKLPTLLARILLTILPAVPTDGAA
ncbi:polarity establishment/cellular polarization [Malassezia nana]|uniref:Polarity establishment/cellular polarization n=1 Tax=Malassezia nana TaxID=180528 RepID=A0AAF0J1C6_9BASI|nr:polarity establishment/cellular polarization [Malassezia nana]